MVAAKTANNKRRGNNNIGIRQRFKPPGNKEHMNAITGVGSIFNATQMLDNPGYVDFNEPPPVSIAPKVNKNVKMNNQNRKAKMTPYHQRLPNMKNGNMGRRPTNINGNWGPSPPPPPHMFSGPSMGPRNGPPPPFLGPMGMRGPPMRGGPSPLMPPPPIRANRRYGPPMPISPLGGTRPLPLMPPMRRPMPPIPPLGRMGPPPHPMRPRPNDGPIRHNNNSKGPNNPNNRNISNNKSKRRPGQRPPQNGKANNIKNNRTAHINPNNQNEYSLDKPWVNDEIKAEHEKKVQLANKLKGNKNDELFAEFKSQRDKFVTMYDAARLEFIGKHPEQDVDKILTESDKVKENVSDSVNVANVVDNKNGETKTNSNTADTDSKITAVDNKKS